MSLADRCEREVRGLHDFFSAWFAGEAASFDRVRRALGEEFEMVTPDGETRDRAAVLAAVRRGRGEHHAYPIRIENLRMLDRTERRCLVTYEEHQADSARVSTALFAPDEDVPEGVRWVHLQETWLPEGEPS